MLEKKKGRGGKQDARYRQKREQVRNPFIEQAEDEKAIELEEGGDFDVFAFNQSKKSSCLCWKSE